MGLLRRLFGEGEDSRPGPTWVEEVELIRWDDSMAVGNALIDGERREIIHMLNRLYTDWCHGVHSVHVHQMLGRLRQMLEIHFFNEEEVLNTHHCPLLAQHHEEHCRLLAELTRLGEAYADDGALEDALTYYVKHLVIDHVLGCDMDMRRYLRDH